MFFAATLFAEGTRELAPNPSIFINGKEFADEAALYIGSSTQGDFANYYNADGTSKLFIHVSDPSTECIYLGFSHGESLSKFTVQFRFRVHDPTGKVVYTSGVISKHNRQIDNWESAFNGPDVFNPAGGYAPIKITSAMLSDFGNSTSGDYYIQFENVEVNDPFLIPWWDITVAGCFTALPVEKKGRVWSKNWVLFTPAPDSLTSWFDRPFNGAFYIVAPDSLEPGNAFITKMDFNGAEFFPAAFGVALNSFGTSRISNVGINRKSVSLNNFTRAEYPIFINDPIELYQTADEGRIDILPSTGCIPSNFCFQVVSTKPGEIEVLLDFFGENGVYDENTADILLPVAVSVKDVGVPICIPWDGVDGQGMKYNGQDLELLDFYISYRQGIFHFPIYDAENNLISFQLTKIRPEGASPLLYYDDSDIPFDSGTGSPNINLTGCETPCHTWTGNVRDHAYGNLNTLNSWWYARDLKDNGRVELRFAKEEIRKFSFCNGDSVVFQDSIMNSSGDHIFYFNTRFACDSLIIYRLNVIDPIAVITSAYESLNCNHPTIKLWSNRSRPSGQIDFLWTGPGNTIIVNDTDDEILIDAAGLYALEVITPELGCRSTTSVEIQNEILYPEVRVLDFPKFDCRDEDKQIMMEVVNPVDIYSIDWRSSNGNIVSGRNLPNLTISEAGTYEVEIMYFYNGCSTRDTIKVIRDTYSYLLIELPSIITSDFCSEVNIQASLNSNAYTNLRWTPHENLSCGDCLNPFLIANESERYHLAVTDTNLCVARGNVDIVLATDYKLFVPNAFSPNNDGINDQFSIYSSACAVDVMSFSIYDQWGARVFNRKNFLSTDSDIGWDGQTLDNPIPAPGIYVYAIELELHDGTHTVLKGDLTLVR